MAITKTFMNYNGVMMMNIVAWNPKATKMATMMTWTLISTRECSRVSSLSDWLLRCWFWYTTVSSSSATDRTRTPMPTLTPMPRMEMGMPTTVDYSLSLVNLTLGNG